eukprot:18164-Heterococcus_DN1.PRE.2
MLQACAVCTTDQYKLVRLFTEQFFKRLLYELVTVVSSKMIQAATAICRAEDACIYWCISSCEQFILAGVTTKFSSN